MLLSPRAPLLQLIRDSRKAILEDWRRLTSDSFEDGGEIAEALLGQLESQLADPGFADFSALDRYVLTCLDAGKELASTLQRLAAMRDAISAQVLPRAAQEERAGHVQELHHALDSWPARGAERFLQMRLKVLGALDRLVGSSAQAHETPPLLQRLLEVCAAEIPALDVAGILLTHDGDVRARAIYGLNVDVEESLRLDARTGLVARLFSQSEPVHLVGDEILEVLITPALRSAGLTALYALRISDEPGEPLGVIFMGSRSAAGFSSDSRVMFGMLAHKASVLLQQSLLRSQLEKAQALVQAFMDHSPAGVFLKDSDHQYLLANRRMEELVAENLPPGSRPGSIVGRTTRDLFPPEVARPVEQEDERILQRGRPVEREQRLYQSRNRRFFLVNKFPVRDSKGTVVALGGIVSEVTDRKRKEMQQAFLATMGAVLLRENEPRQLAARFTELVVSELADLCVLEALEVDGQMHRLGVAGRHAPLAEALRGDPDRTRTHLFSEVERTGSTQLYEVVPPGWAEQIAQDPIEARAWKEACTQSLVVLPLVARGHQVGALAIATCEGERRFRTSDLGFFEELAARVALTVDNALLYGTASRAVSDRDEVAGIVAHDLRGPLNVIVSALQLLLREQAHAPSSAKLKVALRSANRMKRLIDDLLDMTRLEGGKLVVRREILSMAAVVREEGEAHYPTFAREGRNLEVELEDAELWVMGDADRLAQVLENLLSNALKFTPRGGTVKLAAREQGGCALVSVCDTGEGIPRENLRHVFNRFWQASRTDRRGAGLGLAIAEGLISAHEGRIWAESTPGKGTTIRFLLPLHDPPLRQPPASSSERAH